MTPRQLAWIEHRIAEINQVLHQDGASEETRKHNERIVRDLYEANPPVVPRSFNHLTVRKHNGETKDI